MNQTKRDVEAATRRFYEAIETMAIGGGVQDISDSWHHSDEVTSRHPVDNWSVGWDEVWETWKFTGSFGRPDRGGTEILEIRPYVHGDFAYATVIFKSSPSWGGDTMMCTNVLERRDGEWKIVHHHADPSPNMGPALERMLAE